MSYFVVCTFDLNNATRVDYKNAYADLADIGLHKTVVSDQRKEAVAPTTMTMGTFDGTDAASIRRPRQESGSVRIHGAPILLGSLRGCRRELGLGRLYDMRASIMGSPLCFPLNYTER